MAKQEQKKQQQIKMKKEEPIIKPLFKEAVKVENYTSDYYIDLFFDGVQFDISDDQLREDVNKLAPKSKVRTLEELRDEATKNIEEALRTVKFARSNCGNFTMNDEQDDIEAHNEKIVISKDDFKKMMFNFAFIYGNYNAKKKWINIIGTQYYISFPDLLKNGKHASFVFMFVDLISKKLKAVDNAIITVLKKGNIQLSMEQRAFAFSKGHLLNDAHRKEIIDDLKLIFNQIAKPVDKRDFRELKYFGKT
jgi:hypothetical protein